VSATALDSPSAASTCRRATLAQSPPPANSSRAPRRRLPAAAQPLRPGPDSTPGAQRFSPMLPRRRTRCACMPRCGASVTETHAQPRTPRGGARRAPAGTARRPARTCRCARRPPAAGAAGPPAAGARHVRPPPPRAQQAGLPARPPPAPRAVLGPAMQDPATRGPARTRSGSGGLGKAGDGPRSGPALLSHWLGAVCRDH